MSEKENNFLENSKPIVKFINGKYIIAYPVQYVNPVCCTDPDLGGYILLCSGRKLFYIKENKIKPCKITNFDFNLKKNDPQSPNWYDDDHQKAFFEYCFLGSKGLEIVMTDGTIYSGEELENLYYIPKNIKLSEFNL